MDTVTAERVIVRRDDEGQVLVELVGAGRARLDVDQALAIGAALIRAARPNVRYRRRPDLVEALDA